MNDEDSPPDLDDRAIDAEDVAGSAGVLSSLLDGVLKHRGGPLLAMANISLLEVQTEGPIPGLATLTPTTFVYYDTVAPLPKRLRGVMVIALRKLADALERGEIQGSWGDGPDHEPSVITSPGGDG